MSLCENNIIAISNKQKGGFKIGSIAHSHNSIICNNRVCIKAYGEEANKRPSNLRARYNHFNFKYSSNSNAKYRATSFNGRCAHWRFDLLRDFGFVFNAQKLQNAGINLRQTRGCD